MMFRILALIVGLTLASPAAATEPTIEQAYVMKHLSRAILLQFQCDSMQIDKILGEGLLKGYEFPEKPFEKGGAFEANFAAEIVSANAILKDLTPQYSCVMAEALYGAKGAEIPGLLIPD